MILSGKEILKNIGKEIIIDPFDKKRINPNSYNLSLYKELLVYENVVLDMKTNGNSTGNGSQTGKGNGGTGGNGQGNRNTSQENCIVE